MSYVPYQPTEQDYRLLRQHNQTISMRLEFIDRVSKKNLGRVDGTLLDYSLDIDRDSDYRRIFNAEMLVAQKNLFFVRKDLATLNCIVRPYIGYTDHRTSEIIWYCLGTFAFCKKSYTYNSTTNTLTITCNDLMVYLDGTLGGNLSGVNEVDIFAYKDGKYAATANSRWLAEPLYGADCLACSANVKITLPLPFDIYVGVIASDAVEQPPPEDYHKNDTIHLCGHSNKAGWGKSGGRVEYIIKGDDDLIGHELLSVYDTDKNTTAVLKCEKKEIYGGSTQYVLTYELNDNTGATLEATTLESIDLLGILIHDDFIEYTPNENFGNPLDKNPHTPIVMLSFSINSATPVENGGHGIPFQIYEQGKSETFYTGLILNDYQTYSSTQFTTLDSRYDRSINIEGEGNINGRKYHRYTGYYPSLHYSARYNINQFDYGTITIGEGAHAPIRETMEALLNQAGITDYDLSEITETIPYDMEITSDLTYYELLKQLVSLYDDLEMFFDVNGKFIITHTPTTDEYPISLENKIIKPLIISEQYEEDLSSYHNVTEIWGSQIEADYYAAEDTEGSSVRYNSDENCLEVQYTDIALSDNGSIIDGTVLAVVTPSSMEHHGSGLTMNITNAHGLPLQVEESKISKTWQLCDALYWENTQRAIFDLNNEVKTNGLNHNGVTFYGYSNIAPYEDTYHIQVVTTQGLFPEQEDYSVDGFGFCYYIKYSNAGEWNYKNWKGEWYCSMIILPAPKYIYNEEKGIRRLDVKHPENCIKFTAKRGEVIRFYFVFQSALSVADKDGNILDGNVSATDTSHPVSYMDFYPPSADNATYYVFDGITTANGKTQYDSNDGAGILGMSKYQGLNSKFPIIDDFTNTNIPADFLKPNTSYCFRYEVGILIYLGRWKVHAVAIEIDNMEKVQYDDYYKKYNTDNIIITQYNPPLGVDVIGEKNQMLMDSDYDYIYSDALALERADWENWKSVHIGKSLSLEAIAIPWLDANTKITYQAQDDILRTYLIDKISYSADGTMQLDITPFYERYKDVSGLRLRNIIPTDNMTADITRPDDASTMFLQSLLNYRLFDYKFYANTYSDIKNAYGYNALKLWEHWCNHGIREGRRCNQVYEPNVYRYTQPYLTDNDEYVARVKEVFGENASTGADSLDAHDIHMASYLHFLEKGIHNYNTVCSNNFDIKVYSQNQELKDRYGTDWAKYYTHFVRYNYIENRVCK